MVKMIKREKLGFEMFTVVWSEANKTYAKDFWSVQHASAFIAKSWSWVSIEGSKVGEF